MYVSTLDIAKDSMILQNASKEDLILTKKDKPFAVVIDYKKYLRINQKLGKNAKIDKDLWLKSPRRLWCPHHTFIVEYENL